MTVVAGMVALVSAKIIQGIDRMDATMVFFICQIVLVPMVFIIAILMTGNIKRMYIIVIDEYLAGKYCIKVLFYQGYTGIKHTIAWSGLFSSITAMSASFSSISILILLWRLGATEYYGQGISSCSFSF